MSVRPHADEDRLRKRIRYFFATDRRGRSEVRDFAAAIAERGQCAVVGGMLRDLHLGGNRSFRSDVDFVADVDDLGDFDRWMETQGAKVNRFGGYGLRLSNWSVDVWPLQRTWASRHDHVEVRQVDDVLRTTFFDWDAILYYPTSGRIAACDRYFDRVGDKVLDVNLLPNPNPAGNAVRAIRYAAIWGAKLEARLAEHVERQIVELGWDALVKVETKSFGSHHLRWLDPDRLRARLKQARGGAAAAITDDVRGTPDDVHRRRSGQEGGAGRRSADGAKRMVDGCHEQLEAFA